MRTLIAEIKRRRVIPVAAYYVVGAWLILQVADILLPAWGVSPRGIQLIVFAALLGFPIALVFGWRYDLGRSGITRTLPAGIEQDAEAAGRLSVTDFLLLSVMSVALLGIGVWLIDRMLGDAPMVPFGPPNSLVVLAFEGPGGKDQIAIEFTDKLITALISVDGLKVTGRESSLYFAERAVPLTQIAHMLKVRHVLTGSVSQDAEGLSVSARLLRLPEETVIWAQTIAVAEQDLFSLVGDIGGQVAGALRIAVGGAGQGLSSEAASQDPEALGLLRLSEAAFAANDMDRAIAQVEQAVARDPGIARAQVQRATYYLLSFSSRGIPDVETVRRVAHDSLDAAESLGADSAEYHYARGLQARREIWIDGGTPAWHKQLEDSFRRAIALNPSDAISYVSLSIYYRRARRYNDSTQLLETALDYDPLHPGAILQYSRNLSALERKDEALECAMRLPELYGFGEREVAFRYREFQQLDKAVEWFLKAPQDDLRNARDVAAILGSLRARELAADWFRRVEDDEILGPPAVSSALALQGDYEGAYRSIAGRIDDETENPYWLLQAAHMALRAGYADEAIALIERAAPALADPLAPEVTEQNVEEALLLAAALAEGEGNEIRAGVLSGMILNTARNRPAIGWDGIGLRKARVYALQGEYDQAIDAVQAAYDGGFRQIYDEAGSLPVPLEWLTDTPRFDELLERIDADIAAMRERAAALLSAE